MSAHTDYLKAFEGGDNQQQKGQKENKKGKKSFCLLCLFFAFFAVPASLSRTTQEQAAHLTAADVERAFQSIPTKPPTNKNIIEQQHYTVAVARVAGRNGPVELHRDSDRIFFVKSGSAVLRVGGKLTGAQEIEPGEWRSPADKEDGKGYSEYREEKMAAGSVISVPRNVPYQLVAQHGDVLFTVVRIK